MIYHVEVVAVPMAAGMAPACAYRLACHATSVPAQQQQDSAVQLRAMNCMAVHVLAGGNAAECQACMAHGIQ